MSSSDMVYLIALDRSAEGYYGLRARVTGGNIRILSLPEADQLPCELDNERPLLQRLVMQLFESLHQCFMIQHIR
jgi:hypothetical protein